MTDTERKAGMGRDDRSFMGTAADAKAALLHEAKNWQRLRSPVISTRAALRKLDHEEREARLRLANAALLWLWHEENPDPNAHSDLKAALEAADERIVALTEFCGATTERTEEVLTQIRAALSKLTGGGG